MKKSVIERLQKMIATKRKNIEFMKKRIAIQNDPNYDRWAKSGGLFSERQYTEFQVEEEKHVLQLAEGKLKELLDPKYWVVTPEVSWFIEDELRDGKVFHFRAPSSDEITVIKLHDYGAMKRTAIAKSMGLIYSLKTGNYYTKDKKRVPNYVIAIQIYKELRNENKCTIFGRSTVR